MTMLKMESVSYYRDNDGKLVFEMNLRDGKRRKHGNPLAAKVRLTERDMNTLLKTIVSTHALKAVRR